MPDIQWLFNDESGVYAVAVVTTTGDSIALIVRSLGDEAKFFLSKPFARRLAEMLQDAAAETNVLDREYANVGDAVSALDGEHLGRWIIRRIDVDKRQVELQNEAGETLHQADVSKLSRNKDGVTQFLAWGESGHLCYWELPF